MESKQASSGELVSELAGTLRIGITTSSLGGCPGILGLAATRAKSASSTDADLAVGAQILVREAAKRADDGALHGAAGILLGVAPGARGSLLKDRRRQAADLLVISPEHFRKDRERLILQIVADELYAADSAYRLRHRHRTEPERSPEESRLGIDWLEQHRSYRRIWTPVLGLRNDLFVLRDLRAAASEDQPAIADRLVLVTWQWAQFQLALRRFVEDQGGLWLLADADDEIAAADAIYQLERYVPLGDTDNSWLRTLLVESRQEELDGFGDRLVEAGERRKELMALWLDWIACAEEDKTACSCPMHSWLKAAEQFTTLIDKDWYRIADFYRRSAVE